MRPPADHGPLHHDLSREGFDQGLFDLGSLTRAGTTATTATTRHPVAYRQVLAWLDTFVTRPHPNLGRSGAVCPRLAPALRRELVFLVTARVNEPTVDEAERIGRALPDLYRRLLPEPDAFRAGALLVVFADLPAGAAGAFIDGGHARLRPAFVEQGLMLGEFHPASTVGSVHNPRFAVMRSPVPMFAVRALTRHDLLFLDRPDTPAADRNGYLRHYLRHVGAHLSARERDEVQARLDTAADAVGATAGMR